jgi:hypothetical protein
MVAFAPPPSQNNRRRAVELWNEADHWACIARYCDVLAQTFPAEQNEYLINAVVAQIHARECRHEARRLCPEPLVVRIAT